MQCDVLMLLVICMFGVLGRMNGGPGCSSMDGLFLENGPFKLDDQLALHLNPHSWHHLADVLYIDQPVGTGLSFTTNRDGYPRNDEQVNAHL
jgi:carboxypeptidase C (cathepsin A)